MARKNLLKGLMEPLETKSASPAPPTDRARTGLGATKGAVGAVSQSIADLKSRAVIDLDPDLIDAGGIDDRLEHDAEDHANLVASLREYGQQVPVMVRPNADDPDRYQIVYGRRRVMAMRELGLPVKAMVRMLDDQELVLAQGQENSARRDLSFIEKCNFALQLAQTGYDRKIICDALHIDKTLISRMLSVAERIPQEVMTAIGAAHGIGRDRWVTLSEALEASDLSATELATLAHGHTSEDRFEAMLAATGPQAVKPKPKPKPEPKKDHRAIRDPKGAEIGQIRQNRNGLTVMIRSGRAGGFDAWLADNIDEIHRDWLKRQSGE